MKFKVLVYEGYMIPAWYGCAWRDWQHNRMICFPLGLNLIFAFVRMVYFSIKHGPKSVYDNPRAAYDQGYKAALEKEQPK